MNNNKKWTTWELTTALGMSVVEDPTEAGSTSGGGGGNIASSSILMILGFSVIRGF